jgi:hypothetical protein
MVAALGQIGYDALNLGRVDLLLPSALLRRLAGAAPFPFLSANVRDGAGAAPFAATLVRDFGGARVGIVGLAGTQQLAVRPQPGRDLEPGDPFAAAREAVAQLRPACRLVVVLSSLGLDDDLRLARTVPGIDVILGSFSHAMLSEPRVEGTTLILHAGAKGMRLGRLDVEVAAGASGPWLPKGAGTGGRRFAWTLVPLDTSLPDQPALAQLIDRHNQQLRERNLAAAQAAPPPPATLGPAYVGAAACTPCHDAAWRQWRGSGHARSLEALVRKGKESFPECLRCHVTAYDDPSGYRLGGRGGASLADVQCEACHGTGREHRGRDGRIRGRVPEALCRRCHTVENSPTFQYEPYLRRLGDHAAAYFGRSSAAHP